MTYEEEREYEKLNREYTHPLIDLIKKQVQTDIPLLSAYISLMRDKKALKKIDYLGLTVDEIRFLDKMLDNNEKRELRKNNIYLYLNSPTEIIFEEYRELTKSFSIYSVVVSGLVKTSINEHNDSTRILDSRLWYEYLKKLDRLTNGIKGSVINDESNDREKKMFSILCKRIVESVTYDLEAEEMFNKDNKFHSQDATDEIVGVIDGKCVCRGYAGIVRDGCTVLGIDAIVIYGSNGIYGHAWNQVKLDGEWYNVDVTWDDKNILANLDTYWFLTSDKDFNKYGISTDIGNIFHMNYALGRTKENICSNSVSKDKIKNYLNLEEKKKRNWLEKIVQTIKEKNERGIKR